MKKLKCPLNTKAQNPKKETFAAQLLTLKDFDLI